MAWPRRVVASAWGRTKVVMLRSSCEGRVRIGGEGPLDEGLEFQGGGLGVDVQGQRRDGAADGQVEGAPLLVQQLVKEGDVAQLLRHLVEEVEQAAGRAGDMDRNDRRFVFAGERSGGGGPLRIGQPAVRAEAGQASGRE